MPKNAMTPHLRTLAALLLVAGASVRAHAIAPPPPSIDVSSYILYELNSNTVIAEYEADRRLPMASVVKVMTAYIAVDQAAQEQLDMTAEIPVSRKAADAIGSQMFLRARTRVAIPEVMKGIVIQSGNDAAIALAEHIGGSEDGFVDVMNSYARALDMENSLYANSTGLPIDREQYTTARDQTKLVSKLISSYPKHYQLYKQQDFTYADIKQNNRNRLLWLDPTVDGVKTGHTQEAGYCLIASAQRGDMRLISVLAGAASEAERNTYSRRLLEYGFRHFATRTLIEDREVVLQTEVWGGLIEQVALTVGEELTVTLPRATFEELEIKAEVDGQLVAPIEEGEAVGTIRILYNGQELKTVPLVTLQRVHTLGFLGRTWAQIKLSVLRLFGLD